MRGLEVERRSMTKQSPTQKSRVSRENLRNSRSALPPDSSIWPAILGVLLLSARHSVSSAYRDKARSFALYVDLRQVYIGRNLHASAHVATITV